jgi:hypothetical protein
MAHTDNQQFSTPKIDPPALAFAVEPSAGIAPRRRARDQALYATHRTHNVAIAINGDAAVREEMDEWAEVLERVPTLTASAPETKTVVRMNSRRWLYALAAFVLAFAATPAVAAEMPPQQAAFCKAADEGRAAYKAAEKEKNDLRRKPAERAALDRQWSELNRVMAERVFADWIATLARVRLLRSGEVHLKLILPCKAVMATVDATLIRPPAIRLSRC